MNMADVIVPKSDQINADDLIGRDMTITIRDVQIRGGQEQPVSIFFEGSDKAFRPCKSMSRVLVACWGADARQYIGRSLTLYRDPTVKWGGLDVGGIRISHMSHLEKPMTMALTATKGSRKPYTVKPLALMEDRQAQKTDKAADGVRTLIARIRSADPKNLSNVIDDPVVVKQRAWLIANRPELAAEIDAVLAEIAPVDDDPFGGPADEQRGEVHNLDVPALLAEFANAKTTADLQLANRTHADEIARLDDDTRATVNEAFDAAFRDLTRAKGQQA